MDNMYLQKIIFYFSLFFILRQKTGFLRKSGLFNFFLLVYTIILEQKRIARQVQNVNILFLF